MRRTVAFFMLCCAALPTFAAERLSGPVPARVVEVIDGDTIRVRARIWLGQEVETNVRLAGIDTPERRGRCPEERRAAAAARDALAARLAGGEVRLTDVRADKYGGRVLARVLTGAGEDVAASMRQTGLGRAHAGGARPGWCPEP